MLNMQFHLCTEENDSFLFNDKQVLTEILTILSDREAIFLYNIPTPTW